jgi:hypothetical protein
MQQAQGASDRLDRQLAWDLYSRVGLVVVGFILAALLVFALGLVLGFAAGRLWPLWKPRRRSQALEGLNADLIPPAPRRGHIDPLPPPR